VPVITTIDDPADPRIADFIGLRDRTDGRDGGFFVAEGALVVGQLLASRFPVRAVLVTERGLRALDPDLAEVDAPVYIAPQDLMRTICGFNFHRGALASADRVTGPDLETVAGHTATAFGHAAGTAFGHAAGRLLVIEGVNDHENLGALFRNAAAFGVGGVVLDPTTADPLYRRSVRVSMGHVLRVPFTRAPEWPAAIGQLRDLEFEVLALTPAGDAEDLRATAAAARVAVLVGSEGPGLSGGALRAATRRVRIPVAPGVDSLNVATAAAIALHHLA
jgi:tRNA G18 (ribose-2'-O)-methylase SpoU